MILIAFVLGCLTPFVVILAYAAIIEWRDSLNAKRAHANWLEAQGLREQATELEAEVARLRDTLAEREEGRDG